MIVTTSIMNCSVIMPQRNLRRFSVGGTRLRSKKAYDIRPNPGDRMEKNRHKNTYFTANAIC